MSFTIESLIQNWDGLSVIARYHRASASWIFIAIHDDTLGSAIGGTRLRHYDRPADGLHDAMRLAAGMTFKWAAAGLDSGGGKAVLAVPDPLTAAARANLLTDYAQLLNTLSGAFSTGRDLGTSDDDMRALRRVTRYVHGVNVQTDEARDPGPWTARGVMAAIRAVCRRLDGRTDVGGRRVVVQGVGDVGEPLARLLAAAGADLILADVDAARAERLADELGAQVVSASNVSATPCDVLAPCAIGATLNDKTIDSLACRAVAGSANNQLGRPEDAERLAARGIVYAPDYVANCGGALAFGLIARGVNDEVELRRRVDAVEQKLDGIFEEAAAHGESPVYAAQRMVQRMLDDRRRS